MSRPGLSMWGKEGEPMTPQERATAFAEQIVRALDVHPSPINIDAVLPWVKETRRAALLEARQVAITYGERARDEDLSGGYTSELIAQALDRLAQEG